MGRLATGRQDRAAAGSRSSVAVHPPLAPGAYSWAERARGAGGEREGEGVNEEARERKGEKDSFVETQCRAASRGLLAAWVVEDEEVC